MTKQETVKVVTLIVMAYPAAEKLKDENTITAMVEVWSNIFKDDNPRLVELAVQKHIATNKWPPSIAEVREQMANLSHPEIVPPDIAWSVVADLLYMNGSFNDNTSCLPPLIKQCVDAIGWHTLRELHRGSYAGNKDGLDRVAFMEQYKPAYDRARESAMLPNALSESVEKTERILGAETRKQIEAVRKKRKDQEDLWERAIRRPFDEMKKLADAGEPKLLEGATEYDGCETD